MPEKFCHRRKWSSPSTIQWHPARGTAGKSSLRESGVFRRIRPSRGEYRAVPAASVRLGPGRPLLLAGSSPRRYGCNQGAGGASAESGLRFSPGRVWFEGMIAAPAVAPGRPLPRVRQGPSGHSVDRKRIGSSGNRRAQPGLIPVASPCDVRPADADGHGTPPVHLLHCS